jgi:hypothetical protein
MDREPQETKRHGKGAVGAPPLREFYLGAQTEPVKPASWSAFVARILRPANGNGETAAE